MEPQRLALAITGAPGSGKSSTGRELAALMGAALLDLDTLTNPMVDVVMDALGGQGYDDARVAPLMRRARYECLIGAAEDSLRAGTSVVMVAPFTAERSDLQAWSTLSGRLEAAGGQPQLVWVQIGPEELAHRLTLRQASRDRSKLDDLDAYISQVDLDPPQVPHLAVDATDSAWDQALTLWRRLLP